jgi:tetratricopeptide (TPR) repeat protein
MPTLAVETRDHGNFSRLIFSWPRAVDYVVSRDGGTVELHFDAPARIDLAEARQGLPRHFAGIEAESRGNATTVRVRIRAGLPIRHFQKGQRVVLDVLDSTQDTAAHRPSWTTQGGSAAAKAEDGPADGGGSALATRRSPSAAADASAPPRRLTPRPVDPNLPHLRVTAEVMGEGMRMRFHWDRRVGAAVFHRTGHLWIVFDAARRVDLDRLAISGSLTERLSSADQIGAEGATVLRFALAPKLRPRIARSGTTWVVELLRNEQVPIHAVKARAEPQAQGGARVLLPVSSAGRPVRVDDPEVGDSLVIVPLQEPGIGLIGLRHFVQFSLIPTAQGAVIVPHADDILVSTDLSGIAVTSASELFLSADMFADGAGLRQPNAGEGRPAQHLFEYELWRQEYLGKFAAAKRHLQNAVAAADDQARTSRRMELARFYFAYGFAAEAMGVIERIVAEDAAAARSPEFLALRGANLMLLSRTAEAAKDLNAAVLESDLDVAAFERLPQNLRSRFGLLAAHAALAVENFRRGNRLLERVEAEAVSDEARNEAKFLRATSMQKSGKVDSALATFTELAASEYRPVRARAALARIELLLSLKRITRREAIESLEALRHTWRGDSFEQQLLKLLGELYQRERDFMNALSALREAVERFPNERLTPVIAESMHQLVASLFVGGGADVLSPLAALGLYYEFGDLAPRGAERGRIVEGLAQRLLAIDLLDRAAELLESQIGELEGSDKARIGARLAEVLLRDRDPDAALDALDRTSVADASLPLALKWERRQIEARALSQQGQFDTALRQLKGDGSREAEMIRAEVFWRDKQWDRAAAAIARLYPGGSVEPETFSDTDRHYLMRRAVALTMANDWLGLQAMRGRYQTVMRDSSYAKAFDLITHAADAEDVPLLELPKVLADVEGAEAFLADSRAQREARSKADLAN